MRVISPDSRPYAPRGAAGTLLYSHAPEILIVGPAGTGKTRACLEKVLLCAQKYPGTRALLVRRTRASMTQSVLVTLEEKVVPALHPLLSGPSRALRTAYRLDNRSEIVAAGLDNADRIMSTEFDLVAAFEATEITEEQWEKLLSRLRNGKMPYQQAVADCNPSGPHHWLNLRASRGAMELLISRHEDNPALFDARKKCFTEAGQRYMAMLARLTGVRRQRLLEGQWAAAEGLVYPGFMEAVLPENPGTLPAPAVRVIAGVDFGFTEPLAVLVLAVGRNRVAYVVEEIYATRVPQARATALLTTLAQRWQIETFYCDPARNDSIHMLKDAGLCCAPNALRRIDEGIALVETRFMDGRLKIYPRCVETIREAAEYVYRKNSDGSMSNRPSDHENHAMDALRYAINGLDGARQDVGNHAPDGPPAAELARWPTDALLRLGHNPDDVRRQLAAADEHEQQQAAYQQAWGGDQ